MVNMTANNLLNVSVAAVDVPSGAKNVNIYVGTSAGSETVQGQISWFGTNNAWTEPTMGLIAGTALPTANTTKTLTKYGIYELPGGRGQTYPNIYSDNYFIGIETPIRPDTQYNQMRMRRDNFAIDSVGVGDYYCVEDATVDLGSLSGAITLNVANGQHLKFTATSNVTVTLAGGEYRGQRLTIEALQDATGGRTWTKTSTTKAAGGGITLTSAPTARDFITFEWDGSAWVEVSRALNVS